MGSLQSLQARVTTSITQFPVVTFPHNCRLSTLLAVPVRVSSSTGSNTGIYNLRAAGRSNSQSSVKNPYFTSGFPLKMSS